MTRCSHPACLTSGSPKRRFTGRASTIGEQIVSSSRLARHLIYNRRKREQHINSFPNFRAHVKDDDGNGYDIHFAALFSKKPDAIPLTFLHGWPGSFLEFLGIFTVFKNKYSPEELPFHIIAPSLPGYTLSSGPPLDKAFRVQDTARIIDKLLVGLGFGNGYIAQGGDIGAYTCRPLAQYPSCKAVHLNFCLMQKPSSVSDNDISDVEKQGLAKAQKFMEEEAAYAFEHGSRPATIGFVLSSSPLALLAWIGEKFLMWTDEDPPLDDILDSVTLYWLTQTFPRCIYPYEQFHDNTANTYAIHGDPEYKINKPLGYSYFPKELAPMPKSWVATTGNLVWHRQHDRGGHFAAMEKPEEMVKDMEDFVKVAWK